MLEYFISFENLKKIFISTYVNYNKINIKLYQIDNTFDLDFLENNLLITPYDFYKISNKKLYRLDKNNINSCNIINKLYISQNIINELETINFYEELNNKNYKELLFDENDYFEKSNYCIFKLNDDYYYKLSQNIENNKIQYIKENIFLYSEHIYIEESKKNITNYTDVSILTYNKLNFKMNVILILDNKNNTFFINNLLNLLKSEYNNYNIIIFINDVLIETLPEFKNIIDTINKISNIFIFKSKSKKLMIEIIFNLTQLASEDSLILFLDNNYLLNPLFSFEYINLLFFSRQILLTNIYSNKNLNLLIFKKELLLNKFYLNQTLLTLFIEDEVNYYINLLYIILKKDLNNNHFLFYNNISTKEINQNILNKIYENKVIYDKNIIILNYLLKQYTNFSDEKIYLLDYKKKNNR